MIIGIVGRAGSGKDTVANFISQMMPFAVLEKFANPVYQAALACCPDRFREMPYDEFKKAQVFPGVTGRDMLIAVGHGMRTYIPHIWIDLLMDRINSIGPIDHPVIISDVRYLNEVLAIRGAGDSLIIHLESPGREIPDIPSETESLRQISKIFRNGANSDYVYVYNGQDVSLEGLYGKVRDICSSVLN